MLNDFKEIQFVYCNGDRSCCRNIFGVGAYRQDEGVVVWLFQYIRNLIQQS